MADDKKAKSAGKQVRKLTVKVILGGKDADVKAAILEKVMKDKTKSHTLARVWGVATRLKPGSSDFGPYVRFNGAFRAINVESGEVYRSGTLLLPKFLEEELAGAMGSGENVKASEFAIEIGAQYDKTAATSYVYTAESLVETVESDQMLQLEDRIRANYPKALPAPAKA